MKSLLTGIFPVNSLVDVEVRALAKALPTLAALIGLFSSMYSLVDEEFGALAKPLPTLATVIGLFPSVNSEMDAEI